MAGTPLPRRKSSSIDAGRAGRQARPSPRPAVSRFCARVSTSGPLWRLHPPAFRLHGAPQPRTRASTPLCVDEVPVPELRPWGGPAGHGSCR